MRLKGQFVHHPLSNERGVVDATSVHPDGKQLVRVNDHWFFAADIKVKG